MSKEKLWAAINDYVKACGGDPDKKVYGNVIRQEAVAKVESCLQQGNDQAQEALDMLEGYIQARSQEMMKKHPQRFSGAEGNMLFKISWLKNYLGLKDKS